MGGLLRGMMAGVVGGGGDPSFSSVVSGLHFDGTNGSTTFTDIKSKTWTANGNAQISTAQSKFGGAAGLFDGTGDFIVTPNSSDFDFGSGAFTIEFFIYQASTTGFQNVVRKSLTIGYAPFTFAMDSGKPRFRSSQDGANWQIDTTAASSLAVSTWHHIAITRQANALRMFANGTEVGSGTYSSALMVNTSGLYLGAQSDGASGLNGYLDDLRITKGVARYTGSFTPPTAAFPNS